MEPLKVVTWRPESVLIVVVTSMKCPDYKVSCISESILKGSTVIMPRAEVMPLQKREETGVQDVFV